MPDPRHLKIQSVLNEAELAAMDQWALNTSLSIRSDKVLLDTTFNVLSKLWEHFDPDHVDEWCDALVRAKMSAAQSK